MLTTDELDFRLDTLSAADHRPADLHLDAESGSSLAVPDAHLLFQGDYHRVGFDLIITDADAHLTIHDYFRAGKRPTLVAPNGASLSDDIVAALATSDHGERYAQAGAGAVAAQIGRVETMTGSASAVRNGVSVALHPGDPVFKGDSVQTDSGASLGLSFIDGTVFSLSASARMVLNDMVYQAGGTGNSAALSLVQGSISFLAGQVAKTGDMRVGTPVATMGIRGTLVHTENPAHPQNSVTSDNGVVSFSVLTESDGHTGSFQLTGQNGQVIGVVDNPNVQWLIGLGGGVTQETKSAAEQQAEFTLAQQVYQIYALAQANPLQPGLNGQGNPTGPQGGGGGSGSSTSPDINGAGLPSTAPNGSGNGSSANPTGSNIQTPDFQANTGTPADTQTTRSLGQVPAPGQPTIPVPNVPVPVSPAPPGDTGTPQTQSSPPPLASETVQISARQAAVVTDPNKGLLATGGADSATIASEHVVFAEHGTRDDANHIAVDPGQNGTGITGDFGTLDIHADGTYSYVPVRAGPLAEGEIGFDRFTYEVVNQSGQSSVATLTVQITGVNDAPMPTNDSASVAGLTAIAATTRAAGLLGNDTDPDHGETATLHIVGISSATGSGTTETVGSTDPTSIHGTYGTLTLSSDGTYHYVQDTDGSLGAGQTGTDSFTYTVSDPHGAGDHGIATATFAIQVTGAGPFLDLDTSDGSATTSFSTTYAGTGTLVTSSNVVITDPDSTTLANATIHLTQSGNADLTDTLAIDSATLAADHLLFSGGNGTYTLTTQSGFTATEANYQDALQHLTFSAADTLSARDVDVAITSYDGTTTGNTAVSTIHIAASVASGNNVVVNGGFETGDFTGWTLGGNSGFISVDSDAHSGSYAASFGAIGSDTSLDQHLATVAGQHYLLTFWLANDGGTPSDFSALFNGSTVYAITDGPSQGYTEYSYDVVATSSTTDLDFLFRQDPAFWHFDDVSVVAETSTSTIAPLVAAEPIAASSSSNAVADHIVTSATGSLMIPTSALLFNDTTASPDTSLTVHDVSSPASESGTFVIIATDADSASTHAFSYDDVGDQSGSTTNTAQVSVQSGNATTTASTSDTIFLITSTDTGTFSGGNGHDVFVFPSPGSSASYTPASIANAVVGQDALDISFLVQSGQFNVNDSGSFLHLTHLSTEAAGTYDLYLDKAGGGTTTVAHLSGLTVDSSGDPSVTVIWDHHNVTVHASSEMVLA